MRVTVLVCYVGQLVVLKRNCAVFHVRVGRQLRCRFLLGKLGDIDSAIIVNGFSLTFIVYGSALAAVLYGLGSQAFEHSHVVLVGLDCSLGDH